MKSSVGLRRAPSGASLARSRRVGEPTATNYPLGATQAVNRRHDIRNAVHGSSPSPAHLAMPRAAPDPTRAPRDAPAPRPCHRAGPTAAIRNRPAAAMGSMHHRHPHRQPRRRSAWNLAPDRRPPPGRARPTVAFYGMFGACIGRQDDSGGTCTQHASGTADAGASGPLVGHRLLLS